MYVYYTLICKTTGHYFHLISNAAFNYDPVFDGVFVLCLLIDTY